VQDSDIDSGLWWARVWALQAHSELLFSRYFTSVAPSELFVKMMFLPVVHVSTCKNFDCQYRLDASVSFQCCKKFVDVTFCSSVCANMERNIGQNLETNVIYSR
jgi:hypothetical protein